MRPRPGPGLAALVITVALLGACGDADPSDQSSATTATDQLSDTTEADQSDSDTVILKGNKFRPERITIEAGDTVTWEWDDGRVVHDVDGGEAFKSELKASGTFEHTFDEPGVFDYVCTVHPAMTGTVEVTQ